MGIPWMLAIHAISLSVVSLLASATASTPCEACQIFPSCTMRTQCTSDEISARPPLQALPSPKRVDLGSSMALLMLFSKYFWDILGPSAGNICTLPATSFNLHPSPGRTLWRHHLPSLAAAFQQCPSLIVQSQQLCHWKNLVGSDCISQLNALATSTACLHCNKWLCKIRWYPVSKGKALYVHSLQEMPSGHADRVLPCFATSFSFDADSASGHLSAAGWGKISSHYLCASSASNLSHASHASPASLVSLPPGQDLSNDRDPSIVLPLSPWACLCQVKNVVSTKGLWPQQVSLVSLPVRSCVILYATMPTHNRGTALAVFWPGPHHLQAGPQQSSKPNFTTLFSTSNSYRIRYLLKIFLPSDNLPKKTRLRSCRSGLGSRNACCGRCLAQAPLQWT